MTQNARALSQKHGSTSSQRPNDVTLRCRSCRKLFKGPSTGHGDRCQSCDVGTLEVVARISQRMWREHERAFDQRKGAKAP